MINYHSSSRSLQSVLLKALTLPLFFSLSIAQATPLLSDQATDQLVQCSSTDISALKTNQLLLHVQGMVCGMCVQGITKLLSSLEGVDEIDINLDKGAVLVTHRSGVTLPDTLLRETIKRAGYHLQDLHRPARTK
jgi:copper chaperone CopZ